MSRKLSSGAILVEMPHFVSPEKTGPLSVVEPGKIPECPFDVAKRVYYIVNNGFEPETRGGHYHPEGGKQEILICLFGAVDLSLISPSGGDQISLMKPWEGVIIPSGVWHEVRLAPQSILLSVASTLYDPNEAIASFPPGMPARPDWYDET